MGMQLNGGDRSQKKMGNRNSDHNLLVLMVCNTTEYAQFDAPLS